MIGSNRRAIDHKPKTNRYFLKPFCACCWFVLLFFFVLITRIMFKIPGIDDKFSICLQKYQNNFHELTVLYFATGESA